MSFLKIKGKNSTSTNINGKNKKSKNQTSKTVQELMDIQHIGEETIQGSEKTKYYIRVMPKNINIMTDTFLSYEILNLKTVCNICENIEFLVVDKVERLEDNRNYLNKLTEETDEDIFKSILNRDLEHLKELETSKSSSREFYFVISFRNGDKERISQLISNVKQALEDKNFTILETNKNILKNMLQTYFERNFSGEVIKDYDI